MVRRFGWCLAAESWRLVVTVSVQLLLMDALPSSMLVLHDFVGWQPNARGRAGLLFFAPESKSSTDDSGVTSIFRCVCGGGWVWWVGGCVSLFCFFVQTKHHLIIPRFV